MSRVAAAAKTRHLGTQGQDTLTVGAFDFQSQSSIRKENANRLIEYHLLASMKDSKKEDEVFKK